MPAPSNYEVTLAVARLRAIADGLEAGTIHLLATHNRYHTDRRTDMFTGTVHQHHNGVVTVELALYYPTNDKRGCTDVVSSSDTRTDRPVPEG